MSSTPTVNEWPHSINVCPHCGAVGIGTRGIGDCTCAPRVGLYDDWRTVDPYLRDVQRRALVQHIGGLGSPVFDVLCTTFIAKLQDRGFRIVPVDGDAGRWLAEHLVEGDPVTTRDFPI